MVAVQGKRHLLGGSMVLWQTQAASNWPLLPMPATPTQRCCAVTAMSVTHQVSHPHELHAAMHVAHECVPNFVLQWADPKRGPTRPSRHRGTVARSALPRQPLLQPLQQLQGAVRWHTM
jgi:hypothetical protein